MTEFMTLLMLVAYSTAAVVGIQLVANGASRLAGLVARRNGLPAPGQHVAPQALIADAVLLAAGLFLLLQGLVVVLWTFS